METHKKKRLKKLRVIVILGVIVAISSIIFFSNRELRNTKMVTPKYDKVLIIGIDGMDYRVTKELMQEGKLPYFEKLSLSGSFTKLNTSYPAETPVAWTTIATGTNPGQHNIFDFIRRDPENYMPEMSLYDASSGLFGTHYTSPIKADAFWTITSNNNIPTSIIRWPVTFPAEKLDGDMLSGLGVPDIKGFLSGYTFYTTENNRRSGKNSNKVVYLTFENNTATTVVYGSKTIKRGRIVDVTTPLTIHNENDSVQVTVNDKTFVINKTQWSQWIEADFSISPFKKVKAEFKLYLNGTEPFEMYMTTVQFNPKGPIQPISYPSDLSCELADKIGLYYTLGEPEETDGYGDSFLTEKAFLQQIDDIEFEREKQFWFEFEKFQKEPKSVLAFVFDSSDRLQHMFWDEKSLQPEINSTINPAIVKYYEKKDVLLGKILDKIDDKTLLLILSDHGFNAYEKSVNINNWLLENDFMNTTGLPSGDSSLFKYVDWNVTRAYSVGFSGIFINLKGREGQGIVSNKDVVIDKIISGLENLTDSDTKKQVLNAYKGNKIYHGQNMDNAPDIVVGFYPGYRMAWENAVGGFSSSTITVNTRKWKGDHIIDPQFVPGVFFSNFKVQETSIVQFDIAPTILDGLGLRIPDIMEGESLLK